MHKTMRSLLFPLFIACSTLIVGCGSSVPIIRPFKMDIQQGNVVTSKMLLQLRPGMTKSQVKFIMGTPLVIDSFHTNRWDYFYQLRQAGKIVEQRRVILDFEKDVLARVRGDVVPQGTSGADTGVVLSKEPVPAAAKPTEKEGVFENLKFWKNREDSKEKSLKNDAAPKTPEVPANSNTQEVKPVIAPVAPQEKPTELAPATTDSETSPAVETPSLLVVPVTIGPNESAPVENKPANSQPVESIPAAEPPAVESKPAAPAQTVQPVPDSNSPAKSDDEVIFRLDRNLDTKEIESTKPAQNSSKDINNRETAKPVKKAAEVEEKPLSDEEEPGYFERMLEKIGF